VPVLSALINFKRNRKSVRKIEKKGRGTKWKIFELADKPGSVLDNHSSRHYVTAMLKRPTRIQREARRTDSYLVLLQVGFTMPSLLPMTRCALTAPFHPYRLSRRSAFCCTFRRLTPPRYYLAPCLEEPGLSSPVKQQRLPG